MQGRITKRLHISGLKPNIESADLFKRFSNFGVVKSVDGLGLLDGVGNPRKFGYITIETTESDLRKCLNSLSGSTYKGAKLRLAEAKPDFPQRIANENASANPKPQTTHVQCAGVHAPDMSLVTRQNVHARGNAWQVTPTGRILRSMRMRPGKPLVLSNKLVRRGQPSKGRTKGKASKKRYRTLTRARRTVIDMVKCGSVYLSGAFLDSAAEKGVAESAPYVSLAVSAHQQDDRRLRRRSPPRELHTEKSSPPASGVDISPEIANSLNLLNNLFGDKEWEGLESVSDNDGWVTPGIDAGEDKLGQDVHPERPHMGTASSEPGASEVRDSTPAKAPAKKTNLKDLFTFQDNGAQFSLLEQLDLDLDLELDHDTSLYPTKIEHSRPKVPVEPLVDSSPAQLSSTFAPNRSEAMFFPVVNSSHKVRDPIALAKEHGWDWRDPTVGFFRTESEEAIRKKWEDEKLFLTRDWKRRWREARKAKRRRGGPEGIE